VIVYDLVCAQGHRFEGWFASGDEFARQQERALVRCPVCDVAAVERLPSARVSVPRDAHAVPARPAEGAGPESVASLPPELLAKLREVVRNTENVGARFPEEARRIHYDEAPARAIRGQASPEEADALREEGIDFTPLPPFLTGESH
jgi:hypothetical protein